MKLYLLTVGPLLIVMRAAIEIARWRQSQAERTRYKRRFPRC